MAERLRLFVALIAAVVALAALAVAAAELRDPTRPPSAQPAPPLAGRSAPEAEGKLTSIRIDAGQRVATISGVRVKVGDRVGDALVRAIRGTEVVLGTPVGTRVLKLYPGVTQQAHETRPRTGTRLAQIEDKRRSERRAASRAAPSAAIQGESE